MKSKQIASRQRRSSKQKKRASKKSSRVAKIKRTVSELLELERAKVERLRAKVRHLADRCSILEKQNKNFRRANRDLCRELTEVFQRAQRPRMSGNDLSESAEIYEMHQKTKEALLRERRITHQQAQLIRKLETQLAQASNSH